MHLEILSLEQKELLSLISHFKRKYYLVGGTAIALHIGHRMSIDFDLFCEKSFNPVDVLRKLDSTTKHKYRLIYRDSNQLHLFMNTVKLTFFHFNFPIQPSNKFIPEIKMPDLLTLGAMKAFALGGRNKWKDYVDLYFILKDHFSFDQIATKAEELFFESYFNRKLFKGQLAYFADIDYSEEVEFLPGFEVSEEEVKSFLIDIATQPF
jgi:hypothetical protein